MAGQNWVWGMVAALLLSGPMAEAADKVFRGELAQGDRIDRDRKSFADDYEVELTAGDLVTITMVAPEGSDLDTYLKVLGPAGQTYYNDDAADGRGSRLELVVPQTGTWEITATSYDEGETGAYEVRVRSEKLVPVLAERGELNSMSPRLLKRGEYHKVYTVNLEAGKRYAVSLVSADFDTFVAVHQADGFASNDRGNDGTSNSFLIFDANAAGEAKIVATTSYPDSAGRYRLTLFEIQREL